MMRAIETLALKFTPPEFSILDQTLLPEQEVWLPVNSPLEMSQHIAQLKVRGANLIGITAGLSLAQALLKNLPKEELHSQAEILKKTRPTAIHLQQSVERILSQPIKEKQIQEAYNIYAEDKKDCDQLSNHAQPLIKHQPNTPTHIITYCNTGSLATAGRGTALGIIKTAHENKKNIHVYAPETRPVDQGARLTIFELQKENIPCTLLCDNMISSLMSQKKIQSIFVGADRISINFDVVNKIGTCNLAIMAKHFKIPFYVAAPTSAFDKTLKTGKNIPIEQRNPKEVSSFWATHKNKNNSNNSNSNNSSSNNLNSNSYPNIYNPSFDITPFSLITAIITEKEIININTTT